MSTAVTTHPGALWEDDTFEIHTDYRYEATYEDHHCKHAHSRTEQRDPSRDSVSVFWTVPRVIVASNEGGYNTVGLCADCVLEALMREP